MVVNHFDMKESTLTYNLGGMGCSSSLVSVDLAKHLLQARASDLVGWDACTSLARGCLLGKDLVFPEPELARNLLTGSVFVIVQSTTALIRAIVPPAWL